MAIENFPERQLTSVEVPQHVKVVDVEGGRQIVFVDENGEIKYRKKKIFYTISGQMNQELIKCIEDGIANGFELYT